MPAWDQEPLDELLELLELARPDEELEELELEELELDAVVSPPPQPTLRARQLATHSALIERQAPPTLK